MALKAIVSEAGAILALATGLALAVNAVSPAGIPVTRAIPLAELDDRFIPTAEAKARFDAGRTIFVDGRKASEFAQGHIEGAVSLPLEGFETRYVEAARLLPKEAAIVVYCRGAGCSESRQVADRLQQMGYARERLRIFRDGWTAWKARGWPSDTERKGKEPQMNTDKHR
jgi:rhodanese-related sulfurtransferase